GIGMPEVAPQPLTERSRPVEVGQTLRPQHRFTAEEYLRFERGADVKHEYYAGNIYAMPGAGRSHVLIVTNLASFPDSQLRERPCEVYSSDMRLKVNPTGLFTYPGVMVVCGEPKIVRRIMDPRN